MLVISIPRKLEALTLLIVFFSKSYNSQYSLFLDILTRYSLLFSAIFVEKITDSLFSVFSAFNEWKGVRQPFLEKK